MKIRFIFGSGVMIGWLAGLSLSPVIAAVLSSCMAIVTSLISIACGISEFKGKRFTFDPAPCFFLLFGLAIGSPIGVVTRVHGWLGWEAADSARRVGEERKTNGPNINKQIGAGLHGETADRKAEWDGLLNLSGAVFRGGLQRFDNGSYSSLATNLDDGQLNLVHKLLNEASRENKANQ